MEDSKLYLTEDMTDLEVEPHVKIFILLSILIGIEKSGMGMIFFIEEVEILRHEEHCRIRFCTVSNSTDFYFVLYSFIFLFRTMVVSKFFDIL